MNNIDSSREETKEQSTIVGDFRIDNGTNERKKLLKHMLWENVSEIKESSVCRKGSSTGNEKFNSIQQAFIEP